MNRTLLICGIFVLILSGMACSRDAEVEISLNIAELKCEDGQNLIEGYLLELEGIRAVASNIEKHQVSIYYRTRWLNDMTIRENLLAKGFTVDGQSGDPNARRRLPACCLAEADSTTILETSGS